MIEENLSLIWGFWGSMGPNLAVNSAFSDESAMLAAREGVVYGPLIYNVRDGIEPGLAYRHVLFVE